MSALAPTLQAFFTTRLARQRQASPRTVATYRDAFRLLLGYAERRTGKHPYDLDLADLDAALISGFLDHLEVERRNRVSTRNARLTAIHSFYRFAAYRHPEHAELISQVLSIPAKRTDTALVSFLTPAEIDAVVSAPDANTWAGRRDRALLVVAVQTGLRLSELIGLRCADVHLGTGAHLACTGKGRKHRQTPLGPSATRLLQSWLGERGGQPTDPLFPSRRGGPLSPDAVQRLVTKHVNRATAQCPSLASKQVTPHTLRHSCAMELLRHGVDTSVIALWLGHEKLQSTQAYLHADLTIKQRALDRMNPTSPNGGRYRPPDRLLTFLQSL
ncbi:MAG TPA: tyrosine-type recombinase/integrase [Acidimicrobiia bacterium]|nr:tyrosine-type recombinase/integrase [Acidimicrobiia bacterium]